MGEMAGFEGGYLSEGLRNLLRLTWGFAQVTISSNIRSCWCEVVGVRIVLV
jgi:hypothetical protein